MSFAKLARKERAIGNYGRMTFNGIIHAEHKDCGRVLDVEAYPLSSFHVVGGYERNLFWHNEYVCYFYWECKVCDAWGEAVF